MSEEDQERFEDYLELERYISELQAERRPEPPLALTPLQARIYRMAAFFRAAAPGAATPRPEFVADLRTRLEQELEASARETAAAPSVPAARSGSTSAEAPISPVSPPVARPSTGSRSSRRRPRVSRRSLLASGAVAAASLAVGAGLEHALDQSQQAAPGHAGTATPTTGAAYSSLIGQGVPSAWLFVAEETQLGDQPLRFVTETVAGYVIRQEQGYNDQEQGVAASAGGSQVIAFSAACTHMGCLVGWQESDHKFHCPCHGGIFTANGLADASAGHLRYLAPLPRLDTRIEGGKIYVRVPVSGKNP
jgi:Rieske Fe-S protein